MPAAVMPPPHPLPTLLVQPGTDYGLVGLSGRIPARNLDGQLGQSYRHRRGRLVLVTHLDQPVTHLIGVGLERPGMIGGAVQFPEEIPDLLRIATGTHQAGQFPQTGHQLLLKSSVLIEAGRGSAYQVDLPLDRLSHNSSVPLESEAMTALDFL
jgi:hypothetical protein